MKRYTIHIQVAVALVLLMTSCESFLEREPLDFGDETAYFKKVNDLKLYVNDRYSMLPKNNNLWGGLYSDDIQSDNQCGTSLQILFYPGEKKTVQVGSSEWNFANQRALNYFINLVVKKKAAGELPQDTDLVNHYLGEAFFLRAYDYFRLLRNFGDVPIILDQMPDDQAVLTQHSTRSPRNEVARQILADLDQAAVLLKEKAPESGRICRDAALLLKARAALYEATWERYHAGTVFVPGNAKWAAVSGNSGYSFPAGSAEAEVTFFLDQAIAASEAVADARTLNADYQGMFNADQVFPDNDEVILARYYQTGVLSHSCSSYLETGGGCNATRALVNSFLMTNGLPIYAPASGYQGDKLSYYEFQDRDPRLTGSVRAAGSIINTKLVDGRYVNDTIFYYKPNIYRFGNEKATTGYELQKWFCDDKVQCENYQCTTATPILRAAEAYLIYLEAYYERYHDLGGKCDAYWRSLRTRAGINPDYTKTIAATDLAQENDLAVWSKGVEVDATLYNIRRERRCELIAEGLRLDDLKRWRALDMMTAYQPEGFNLWDEMYKMYKASERDETIVTQSNISKYIRPLQVSATSAAYSGYNFPRQHYLEPIPISEFLLTGEGVAKDSPLYQNPGWPQEADGPADYTFDCD